MAEHGRRPLTTEALVSELPEKTKGTAVAGAGGMGGMY
jgi:hypothetical protein